MLIFGLLDLCDPGCQMKTLKCSRRTSVRVAILQASAAHLKKSKNVFSCFLGSRVYGKHFESGRIHSGGRYPAKVEGIRLKSRVSGKNRGYPAKTSPPNTLDPFKTEHAGYPRVYPAIEGIRRKSRVSGGNVSKTQ